MVTVNKVNFLWDEMGEPVDPSEYPFDEYKDFDYGQWGHTYEFYHIKDMAYWDAIVVWDTRNQEVVAIRSQVISLEEANQIIRGYVHYELVSSLPY